VLNKPQRSANLPAVAAPGPTPLDFVNVPPASNRDLDLGRLWKTLVRRRALFFSIWLAFAGAVAIFTLLQPKNYTTTVKLIAGSSSGPGQGAGGDAGTNLPILNALLAASGVQSSETYAELIQQVPVAQEVIARLALKTDPNTLLDHVRVRPVTDTAILTLSVAWRDPANSALIANTFASVFLDHERQLVAHQADSVITFLQKELPGAEARMRAAQDALAAYQVRSGIVDLPTQTANFVNDSAAVETKRQTAELEARQAAAQLDAVDAQLAQTPPTVEGSRTVAANPVSGTLEAQISSLRVQLGAARKQYTDDYPTVISLKSQLAEAERQLKSQPTSVTSGVSTIPNPVYQQLTQQATTLRAQIASAQTQADGLAAVESADRAKLDALPSQAHRITELQREAKAAQDVYEALERKNQDAMISRTTALSDVAVTQPADASVYRTTPNVPFNIALGIVVGLALALTTVFLTQFIDDRLRTEEDVAERLGLPVLAQIPMLGNGDPKSHKSDPNEWLRPLSVESFYQLVASLRYSSSTPPRTIAFTSADQGDGKSTIALNSAISMGMMKARVLIVDADLRRPSIHAKLRISNEPGLSDVLVGMTSLEEAVRPTEHMGVSVLTCGRPAPNPVALLQGPGFDQLLEQARESYDFVIVDGPALRSIIDGVVLGIKTEGLVMVVSAQQSETRSVRKALDKLRSVEGINLLGVVLNATTPNRKETAPDYYLGVGTAHVSLPPDAPA
jgi:succinoglycan biosynthesis transport protein ExoP